MLWTIALWINNHQQVSFLSLARLAYRKLWLARLKTFSHNSAASQTRDQLKTILRFPLFRAWPLEPRKSTFRNTFPESGRHLSHPQTSHHKRQESLPFSPLFLGGTGGKSSPWKCTFLIQETFFKQGASSSEDLTRAPRFKLFKLLPLDNLIWFPLDNSLKQGEQTFFSHFERWGNSGLEQMMPCQMAHSFICDTARIWTWSLKTPIHQEFFLEVYIYPKELKEGSQRGICTPMCIAA